MSEEQKDVKKVKRSKGFLRFGFILLTMLFLFISPIPSMLFNMIPEHWLRDAFKDIYQDVVLDDAPALMSDPLKYTSEKTLAVLGINTGVCFTIAATRDVPDESKILTSLLNDARRGETIANIIAIGDNEKEYKLRKTSLDESDGNSVICQKFGNDYSLPPETVTEIYIQPLSPMAPSKIMWGTAKTIY